MVNIHSLTRPSQSHSKCRDFLSPSPLKLQSEVSAFPVLYLWLLNSAGPAIKSNTILVFSLLCCSCFAPCSLESTIPKKDIGFTESIYFHSFFHNIFLFQLSKEFVRCTVLLRVYLGKQTTPSESCIDLTFSRFKDSICYSCVLHVSQS